MKILVDITHPAHVHFFKHAIHDWRAHGHQVIITSRDKDLTLSLLDRYGLAHTPLSRAQRGVTGLGLEMLERGTKLWPIVRRERPAVLTAIAGTFIAPVGKLSGTPVVLFTDTEHAKISNAIAFPLANVICTPECYEGKVGPKQIVYAGYHELAYLHPNRFQPDPDRLRAFGVSVQEPYIVMRLVAWSSGHDIGDSGFNDLPAAVETLSRYGKVLISSEKGLPADLAQHSIQASPDQIHHLLAFATLFIGESATMASESALLGVPALFVSSSTRGYTNEQERKYQIGFTFSGQHDRQQQALAKAVELLSDPAREEKWKAKRARLLAEKIDVTQFIVETVEKYGHNKPVI